MQRLTQEISSAWQVPKAESAVDWVPENIIIPAETETPGPFDLDTFPHVIGVLQAVDDPMIREIYLPWAARLGKTMTALSAMIFLSQTAPRPGMLARENEEKIDDLIENQLYPLLEASPVTSGQLKPTHKRNIKKRGVELAECRFRRVFSGSPGTMAGFPACYALASEVSKWSKRKSSEADPLFLFTKRGLLFPFDPKYIFESTPGEKGRCNITDLSHRQGVTILRRYVQCPHCGRYQLLTFGRKGEEGPGIKWDRDRAGRSDPRIAEETAFYQCAFGCRIENIDRPSLIRNGIWSTTPAKACDAGDKVLPARRKKPVDAFSSRSELSSKVSFGDPDPENGTGNMGSLYSLAIGGWGQLAREFLDAQNKPEALRDFTNSIRGLVWDSRPVVVKPHDLADRLCDPEITSAVAPLWAKIITIGVDVQANAERFEWVATAWGDGGIGAEIDHGEAYSWDELTKNVIRHEWSHSDGGAPLASVMTLVDSGDETEIVYGLCRGERKVLPCKGMSSPFGTEYRKVILRPENRRNKNARGDVTLVEINTHMTNSWLQRHIEGTNPPEIADFVLSSGSAIDIDFLDQLLNEQKVHDVDANGYEVTKWIKVTSGPNDKRDALRYAKVAASVVTNNGKNWHRLPDRASARPAKKKTIDDTDSRFRLLGPKRRPQLTRKKGI